MPEESSPPGTCSQQYPTTGKGHARRIVWHTLFVAHLATKVVQPNLAYVHIVDGDGASLHRSSRKRTPWKEVLGAIGSTKQLNQINEAYPKLRSMLLHGDNTVGYYTHSAGSAGSAGSRSGLGLEFHQPKQGGQKGGFPTSSNHRAWSNCQQLRATAE